MHILIVEDDRTLTELLARGLSRATHTVEVVHDGDEGLARAASGSFDALILDVMLPDVDGLEIAHRLRAAGVRTPILMLTARDALYDRLRGFDAGADDYLAKPFALEEVLARLKAITRRGDPAGDEGRLMVGDLVLDRRAHEVTRAGHPIALSPREFALLEYLMRHAGQVLSQTMIREQVWKDDGVGAFANVVEASIHRLRKAVDEGYPTPLIQTVRGTGYKIKAP
jgi:two-component system OmpR family response regulator